MEPNNNVSVNPAASSNKRLLWSKVSFVVLLALTFLTPIFFVPASFISTQFGTSLLFAFGVILSVLIYVVSGLVYGYIDLPKPGKKVLLFTVLVPVVYTLAGIANGFSRMSFFGYTFDSNTVGFIVLGFIYLFLVSVYFKDKNRIFYSYFAFVISSLILGLFLIIRMIFGADVFSFGIFTTMTSTMVGSWNNVGIFFGIGTILSLLTYQMVNVSKFMKVVLSLALLVSLLFLALINFTIIWSIVGICSFLFILYSLFSSGVVHLREMSLKQKVLRIPLYPFIVLVISLVFVIWSNPVGGYLGTKLEVTNVEVRPSLMSTLDIARNTIVSKPLFGSGPNTFVNQWLTWKPDDIISTVFWNTDFNNGIGLIPTFAVTTGLIGVLSWLVFLGFYVYLGVKSIFSKIDDSFVKYLLTSSFFVSLYLWIMAFAYVPSTVIFILTLFFTGLFFSSVYLAGFIEMEPKNFGVNPRTGFISSLIMVVIVVGTCGLGYGLYKNSKSLWYFQKSSFALNNEKNITMSEDYMIKAISTVPNDIYYRALSEIELIKLNAILSQDPSTVKKELVQEQFSETLTNAIKAGLAAKDTDPDNYLNWISVGQVYGAVSIPELKVEGAYESSQLAFTEALKRNPKNPGILVLAARAAVTHADLTAAKNYTLGAISLKKNYLDAYFLLSQIEVASKNIQGAIDSVTAASIIDPTNPAIFFQLGLLKYNIKDFNGAVEALEKATTMTPDYANAKYFLGLSYEARKEHEKAIEQFEALKVTNPDSKEVDVILTNLKAGKPIFDDIEDTKPEKGKTLPVKEKVQ